MRTFHVPARLWLCCLLTALQSCALIQLPASAEVPAELLATSDRFLLKGGVNLFQHTVRFGPYAMRGAWVGPLRGDGKEPTVFNGQVGRMTYKQKATFEFTGLTGRTFHGVCRRETLEVTQYYRGLLGSGKDEEPPQLLEKSKHVWCKITQPDANPMHLETADGAAGEVRGGSQVLSIAQLAARGASYEYTDEQLGLGSRPTISWSLRWT